MTFLNLFAVLLPLENPVVKYLLILVIILFTPILLNKIKVPQLLGLIIAGAIVGPHGFYLIERDNGIILSGTAGLLYIMFLAGLEIDLDQFRKNSKKSLVFGMYTFVLPMILGTLVGIYVLHFSVPSSVLLASMFASHTLIAYPLISKLGVAKNRAVNITIGGTMITDTLALLVLAGIVGMTTGEVTPYFWVKLSLSIVAFGSIVMLLFPLMGRWFFKRFDDNVSQYIFILAMVFLGAALAELAGIEGIVGAFLTGLTLSRLIPRTSPLMNRVDFVGNAIFIPFFLIGVGMLIDYRAFFKDFETLLVAGVMIITATTGKFLAAWLAQQSFKLTRDERRLIFGLSNAQAAATLAAVLIGYNLIVGESATGEPIRLFSESVLNGTILMILVTCTHASLVAQKGATNIALSEVSEKDFDDTENQERILIPMSNLETIEELVNLGITVKSKVNRDNLYALTIINHSSTDHQAEKNARLILKKAAIAASATDNIMHELFRYDLNITNGITSVVKEHKITDLILGLHIKQGMTDSFLGTLTEGILTKCNATTLIYKPNQPFVTIKRHIIIVPQNAEKEIGFPFWILKVWNIARNSGARLIFHASPDTIRLLKEIQVKHPITCTFSDLPDWDDLKPLIGTLQEDDNLIFVLSRRDRPSYLKNMDEIPVLLNSAARHNNFILIYPAQSGVNDPATIDLTNPALVDPMAAVDDIRKTIQKLLGRK